MYVRADMSHLKKTTGYPSIKLHIGGPYRNFRALMMFMKTSVGVMWLHKGALRKVASGKRLS
jgi:hypothetical protein